MMSIQSTWVGQKPHGRFGEQVRLAAQNRLWTTERGSKGSQAQRRRTSDDSGAPCGAGVAPCCNSSRLSSSAVAVARSTRLVMPSPYSINRSSSNGESNRGVNPPANRRRKNGSPAGRNGVRSPPNSAGLMPTKSTSSRDQSHHERSRYRGPLPGPLALGAMGRRSAFVWWTLPCRRSLQPGGVASTRRERSQRTTK